MDFQYIIFVLLFLWFIHILHRILYVVYFWQVKEYRLDRMKGDLKKTLNVLFPKTAILSLLVLIILPIFLAKHNVSVWDSIVLFVFCLFGLYSLALLAKKSWRIPKFTKKASVLAILSIISLVLFFFVSTSRFFIFIVLAEIIFPLITLVLAEILQIPTFFIK